MALRPVWRGHLRLALVSCPVALYSAKHSREAIRFSMINPETGHRIRMLTVDAETGDKLERRNLAKGYEFKKDHFLLLTEADLDSVKVESSSLMAVEKFVDSGSIDPIYYDAAYFLAPDGDAGRDVYYVLREAIARTGRVALSRVVISQRERVIALRPYDRGLAAHTLDEQRDLNAATGLFGDAVSVDEDMVKLAVQLIDRQTADYDAADIEDRYEARLRAMLDAKLKGEGIEAGQAPEPSRSNVVDLMAALKRSLGQADEKSASVAEPPARSEKGKEATKDAPAKARRKRA